MQTHSHSKADVLNLWLLVGKKKKEKVNTKTAQKNQEGSFYGEKKKCFVVIAEQRLVFSSSKENVRRLTFFQKKKTVFTRSNAHKRSSMLTQ